MPDQPFYGTGLAGEQSRGSRRLTVAHDSIFGNYTGWLSFFRLSLPLLFGLAICLQVLAYANKVLGDPDTYWHIAIGPTPMILFRRRCSGLSPTRIFGSQARTCAAG